MKINLIKNMQEMKARKEIKRVGKDKRIQMRINASLNALQLKNEITQKRRENTSYLLIESQRISKPKIKIKIKNH